MIIDAHCHIWERDLIKGDMARLLDSVFVELGLKDKDKLYDGSLERLIREMDEAKIDKTVILPLDFEFLYSGGGLTFREFNDLAGRYLKEAPDRVIPFAGIDPRRGKAAAEELKRCVEEMGFSGLKLWTVSGFVPDDENYYPLYEAAASLGVNVLVHTGMGPGESYLKTCRPVFVDKIAVDFREINFIMAHVGTPWTEEALAVAMKNPNVYVDLSAWQAAHAIFPLGLAQVLSLAKLMHGGVNKVLFGSDWPLFTDVYSQKQWVEVIRSMDYPAPLQIMGLPEITDDDKEMILGKNAQKALKL
jgi:hypothetical protein